MQLPKEAKQVFENSGYYITPDGRLFSAVKRKTGGRRGETYIDIDNVIEYKQHIVKGYKQVFITKKNCKIHRLVALLFIPNPDNKPLVCHKDSNPLNNDVSNLYWGTLKDNVADSIKAVTNAFVHNHPMGKLKSLVLTRGLKEEIYLEKVLYKKTWDEIALKFNVARSTIAKAFTGDTYKGKFSLTPKKFEYKKKYILENRDEIKRLYQSGITQVELARRYKLGKLAIWRICNNLSYQK